MKSKPSSAWSAAKSEEHFGFKRWGQGHLSVDDEGFVNVQPLADDRSIRLLDVIHEALGMGLKAPMVVRFQDLLRHRVIQLNELFAKAVKEGQPVPASKEEKPARRQPRRQAESATPPSSASNNEEPTP